MSEIIREYIKEETVLVIHLNSGHEIKGIIADFDGLVLLVTRNEENSLNDVVERKFVVPLASVAFME